MVLEQKASKGPCCNCSALPCRDRKSQKVHSERWEAELELRSRSPFLCQKTNSTHSCHLQKKNTLPDSRGGNPVGFGGLTAPGTAHRPLRHCSALSLLTTSAYFSRACLSCSQPDLQLQQPAVFSIGFGTISHLLCF